MIENKNQANSFTTTCCYCGVGCGIVVQKDKNGNIAVEGDKDRPVNDKGPEPGLQICPVIKLRLMRLKFLFTPTAL